MKDRPGATEASVAGVRPLDVRGFAAPYQTSLLKPAACLDAVAARLVDIEEDGLPNRMLCGPVSASIWTPFSRKMRLAIFEGPS